MDTEIQKALQEVFILATGRAASSSELAMLETYRGNGDWQPLVNLVNQYMNGVAEAQGGGWQGVSKTVQLVAKNAFGLNLSLQEAQSAAHWLVQSQGVDSWAKLFKQQRRARSDAG